MNRPVLTAQSAASLVLFALASFTASAHVPNIIVLEPSDDWCDQIRVQAVPADVIQLLPGRYPGGCDLDLGGEIDLNEALLVSSYDALDPAVIEADEAGVSLHVSGEPTRLLQLELEGTLEVRANNTTVDNNHLSSIDLQPGFDRFIVAWSSIDAPLLVEAVDTVVRGNTMPSLVVDAETGLVADNAIDGDASSNLPFHRNLVTGDLLSEGDAFANVVRGEAVVGGALYGNTLLGPVSAGDSRNNLTIEARLPGAGGNLRCESCLVDPMALDVRPRGVALNVVPVDAPGDTMGFCGQSRSVVGAVGVVDHLEGLDWSAFDRIREGCVEGGTYEPPPPPPEPPPEEFEPITEPEAEPVRTSTCSTSGAGPIGWLFVVAGGFAGFVRRLRPRA